MPFVALLLLMLTSPMTCSLRRQTSCIVLLTASLAPTAIAQTGIAQTTSLTEPASLQPAQESTQGPLADISAPARFNIPGFAPVQEPRVRVRAELMAWYMGPGGELRMPRASGESATIDIDSLSFDTPQVTPVPEINIFAPANPQAQNWFSRRGWRVGGRAFVFGDDNRTVANFAGQIGERAVAVGQTLSSSLDYASAELEAGVNVHTFASASTNEQGTPTVSSTLEAIAGLQAIDCTWRVTIDNIPQEASVTSVGVLAGGRLAFAFDDRFLVDVTISATIGVLGDEMAAGDVVVGGSYMFTRNLGLQIGYRSAFFSLAGDEGQAPLDYTGSHQGLMVGLALRF